MFRSARDFGAAIHDRYGPTAAWAAFCQKGGHSLAKRTVKCAPSPDSVLLGDNTVGVRVDAQPSWLLGRLSKCVQPDLVTKKGWRRRRDETSFYQP